MLDQLEKIHSLENLQILHLLGTVSCNLINEKYNVMHSGTIIQASNKITLGSSINRASVRELVVAICRP